LQQAVTPAEEAALKASRNYGGSLYRPSTALPENLAHQHIGQIIVSYKKADLPLGASGIAIYADHQKTFESLLAPRIPRSEVIDELHDTLVNDSPPFHSGEWARATTAVCLALLESARTHSDCYSGFHVSHNPLYEQRHTKDDSLLA
jgi:phthalate 4,5-cis-dihydrodiol dehydrogenase